MWQGPKQQDFSQIFLIVFLPLENIFSLPYTVGTEKSTQLESNGERLGLFNSILTHLQKKRLCFSPFCHFILNDQYNKFTVIRLHRFAFLYSLEIEV